MKNDVYKSHFQDPRFEKIFLDFKYHNPKTEVDFSTQCASILFPKIHSPTIDMLEIGAGDGLVSLGFLEEITKTKNINSYIGLDSAQELVTMLTSKKDKFEKFSQKTEFICSRAEDYTTEKRFDLILAMNSFYGISFSTIPRLMPTLKNGGIFAIMLNSERNLIIDLTKHFVEPIVTGEELIEWLQRHEIKHAVIDLKSNYLSKEYFLTKNGLNPKAEVIYRYVLRRVDEPLDDIFEYISKKLDDYFKAPQKLILVAKDES